MPNFIATAAVTWAFSGASESVSRTIPAATVIYAGLTVFDGTGETHAMTMAGAAPIESYEAFGAPSDPMYQAVFGTVPTGGQLVGVSGGNASSGWVVGFRGVDDVDLGNPFDGEVVDSASAASISVVTTADGLAVGIIQVDNNTVTTSDTEVFEQDRASPTICISCASSPGTGGSVSLDWSGGGTAYVSTAVNLRHTVTVPSSAPRIVPLVMRGPKARLFAKFPRPPLLNPLPTAPAPGTFQAAWSGGTVSTGTVTSAGT